MRYIFAPALEAESTLAGEQATPSLGSQLLASAASGSNPSLNRVYPPTQRLEWAIHVTFGLTCELGSVTLLKQALTRRGWRDQGAWS